MVLAFGSATAAECTAHSSEHRVALLELYTSEGCNSCPPADRWLNALRDRGVGPRQVIPLAFHVDYWDYIGWRDRFAQPEFSQRQRLIAARNQASFIYTPQFVLDGRDIRRPWLDGNLAKHLDQINDQASLFDITAELYPRHKSAKLAIHAKNRDRRNAHLYIALYENGLSSEVRAGENAGKRLYHQHVVRQFFGPLTVAPGANLERDVSFDLAGYGTRDNLGLAIFAEAEGSGATMQAMALPFCSEP